MIADVSTLHEYVYKKTDYTKGRIKTQKSLAKKKRHWKQQQSD